MSSTIEEKNIQLVKDAMDGILVEHDEASVDRHFHATFVQHNPWARDGAAHVKEMCAFTFGLKAARWAAQGDLVASTDSTAPRTRSESTRFCASTSGAFKGSRSLQSSSTGMPSRPRPRRPRSS